MMMMMMMCAHVYASTGAELASARFLLCWRCLQGSAECLRFLGPDK